MGRDANPIFKRGSNYYARWYVGKRRVLLSLGTQDPKEAYLRYPIVQSFGKSWDDYQRSLEGMATATALSVKGTKLDPPPIFKTSPKNLAPIIEEALLKGQAVYDEVTESWRIKLPRTPENEDQDLVQSLTQVKKILHQSNDTEALEKFYTDTIISEYLNKPTAKRDGAIWLQFLKLKGVRSWSEIDEALCREFKDWRLSTPISRANYAGEPPCGLTVRRHIRFLSKSFDLAVEREYMKFNPVKRWKPIPHTPPLQQSLSKQELMDVLSDDKWKQNFLMSGATKLEMPFRLLDFLLILFCSCKRRKEIINLKIEDLNFDEHFVTYEEFKNSSRGNSYQIRKAFWMTTEMEETFKRIIDGRTSGFIFAVDESLRKTTFNEVGLLNGDYLSELFKKTCKVYAPTKKVKLHNLRHTATDMLESAGFKEDEIDNVLGHYNVGTALKNYQARSKDAIARRLSAKTRKGVEVLNEVIKTLF